MRLPVSVGATSAVLFLLYCFLNSNDLAVARAAQPSQTSTAQERSDQKRLDIEERKLDLEKEKLVRDREKDIRDFNLEERKAWLSAFSIAGPLLLGLLAYVIQNRIQRRNEALQFKLKAAEVAMSARDATQVKAKADILKALFPNELRDLDSEEFDPKKSNFSRSVEARESLISMLAEYPTSREEIIRAWGIVFPWDDPEFNKKPEEHRKNYRWFGELKKDALLNQNRPSPEPPNQSPHVP